jgi:hypothetical protein
VISTAGTDRPSAARSSGTETSARRRRVDIDPAAIQGRIDAAVPSAMLTDQRQLRQRPHRPVHAQHCVHQIERRVRPPGQAPIQLPPKPRKVPNGASAAGVVHTVQLKPLVVEVILSQEVMINQGLHP